MSSPDLPDLWPEDIGVDENVLTPLAILKIQARNLERKMKGFINTEVLRDSGGDTETLHFVLKAPALGYSYGLLSVVYKATQVYPVEVQSSAFQAHARTCYTQQELTEALGTVFRDGETRAIITSIIAQSRDPDSLATAHTS